MTDTEPHVFRVDEFVVPSDSRKEFLPRVRQTHDLLKDKPGFVQDLLLEQSGNPGEFTVVTMVEWESEEAIENARDAVGAMREQKGFDPQELFSRLGIEATIATYTPLDG